MEPCRKMTESDAIVELARLLAKETKALKKACEMLEHSTGTSKEDWERWLLNE